ncbi:hypothetical protein JCM3770_004797 [Rhodotorula araucariae]
METAQQRLERDYIMSFGNELGFRSPGALPNPSTSSFAQLDGASGVIRNHQQPPPAFHPYQYPPMQYNQAQYLPPPPTQYSPVHAGLAVPAVRAGQPAWARSSQASLPLPSGIPSPSNLVSSRLLFPV